MRSLFRRSTRGVAGAVAAAVLVGGTAAAVTTDGFGSSGSSSATLATPTTVTVPTTAVPTTAVPTTAVPTTAVPTTEAAATTHPVLEAGTVTVALEGAVLRVVDVRTNAGWTNNVERGLDREVEVTFRRGSDRIDFNAELEDGQVRIRISDRRSGTATPSTGAPSPTVPAPSTTLPAPTLPAPTLPAPTLPTAPQVQTFASAGGSVTVAVQGNSLVLSLATPASGYRVDVRESGPDRIEVRFESDDHDSRIELRLENGRLEQRVDND